MSSRRWSSHIRLQRHLEIKSHAVLKVAQEETEGDKNGIIVSDGEKTVDFGVTDIQSQSIQSIRKLSLENTNSTDIILCEARISSVRSAFVFLLFLAVCRY